MGTHRDQRNTNDAPPDVAVINGPLRPLLQAYETLQEESKPLSEAMHAVADKLLLLCMPDNKKGPVQSALDQHPGARERVGAQLISRIEQFRGDADKLRARYDAQHGSALQRCRAALNFWLVRQEVGAPPVASEEAVAAAQHVQSALNEVHEGLQGWRAQLTKFQYMGMNGTGESTLQIEALPKVDIDSVLESAQELLDACATLRIAGSRH